MSVPIYIKQSDMRSVTAVEDKYHLPETERLIWCPAASFRLHKRREKCTYICVVKTHR